MSLSLNAKQYRIDHFLSQEYVAEKLHMSQPAYSRLENSDTACTKRLPQIANALGTTPNVLKNYHLTPNTVGEPEAADWVKALLLEKDVLIQQQKGQIDFLGRYADYVKAVAEKYALPFDESDNDSPADE